MKAKELIKILQKLVKENGDIGILISNPETAFFDTIKDAKVVIPNEFNGLVSPGIELEAGLR